jgi:hypothetical protein
LQAKALFPFAMAHLHDAIRPATRLPPLEVTQEAIQWKTRPLPVHVIAAMSPGGCQVNSPSMQR